MIQNDTIIAISSPMSGVKAGEGDEAQGGTRGIVRLSGSYAWTLAAKVLSFSQPLSPGWHGQLCLPLLHPSAPLAAALLFQSPRSFTGEDVAELHLPASPALLNAVVQEILVDGNGNVRIAEPGEFSARAFFNGKIDLTEAEGIAATINAANESQLRAASSLRSGDLHRWTAAAADRLAEILALIEAGIDFVEEEDVHLIDESDLLRRLGQLAGELCSQIANAIRLDRLDALPTAVFIGRPNVGKSSLVNALTNTDRSITSPIAGTTRDMLSAILHAPQGDIRLLDVPGEEAPSDELRQKMMEARQAALLEADLVVEVLTDVSAADTSTSSPPRTVQTLLVQNKADLLPPDMPKQMEMMRVSAKTGLHLDMLSQEIARLILHRPILSANVPALNHRHRITLHQTAATIQTAIGLISEDALRRCPEILAAELRHALDLLGQITGAISPDDVIGKIFSRFCIGK